MTNPLTSLIVRVHDIDKLPDLELTLAAAIGQTYRPLEIVLMTQRFAKDDLLAVRRLVRAFPRDEGLRLRLFNYRAEAPEDARTTLINLGVAKARGRYLGFLDSDDVIYPDHVARLVERCRVSGAAVAFSGVLRVDYFRIGESRYITRKYRIFEPRPKLLFYFDNNHPIHTYIIDSARLKTPIAVPPDLSRHEDYLMLMSIVSRHEADYGCWRVPTAEYFIDMDGGNTILAFKSEDDPARVDWEREEARLEAYKREIRVQTSIEDIRELADYLSSDDARALMDSDGRFRGRRTQNPNTVIMQLMDLLAPKRRFEGRKPKITLDKVSVSTNRQTTRVDGWVASANGSEPAVMSLSVENLDGAGAVCVDFLSREDVRQYLIGRSGGDRPESGLFGFQVAIPGLLRAGDKLVFKILFRDGSIVRRSQEISEVSA